MGFKFGSSYGREANEGMNGKLQKIREHLKALAGKGGQQKVGDGATAGRETIADDTAALADKAEVIRRDEALVRDALALFGVDYDGLIGMTDKDGKPSVYAQALQANPQAADGVASAPQPVLAALQVALGYKPFAEFAARYGETPDAIKESMRAEVLAEARANGEELAPKKGAGPVFSSQGGQRVAAKPKAKAGLRDLFGK